MFVAVPEPASEEAVKANRMARSLANLRLVGISYRTAPLSLRSCVSVTEAGCRALLQALSARGVEEAAIISTCNRTEIYFSGADTSQVLACLSEASELSLEQFLECAYRSSGIAAVRHLFRVASGLDSAVLGENEVIAQIKAAFQIAKSEGMVGKTLDPVYQRSLRVGKQVRTQSELGREAVSVASVALRKAEAIAGPLRDRSILLIGAGQIAERVAKELAHFGCSRVTMINRSEARAQRLADIYSFDSRPYEELWPLLAASDVVVCAVSSSLPILTRERIETSCSGRRTLIVDLGVPPNVEPLHPPVDSVQSLDMEAIAAACELNSQRRAASAPQAEAIVERELEGFADEALQREAAPIIEALVYQAEAVRKRNLDWALSQAPPESARERKLLEDLSIRIVRGMLEAPIVALKTELRAPVERAVLTRLFGVEVPETVVKP